MSEEELVSSVDYDHGLKPVGVYIQIYEAEQMEEVFSN